MKPPARSLVTFAFLAACARVPPSDGTGGGGGEGGAIGSCSVASDCGVDTACISWSCPASECVAQAKAEGPLPDAAQAAGDCARLFCDGDGNLVGLPDDADLPSDGSECTADGCFGGDEVYDPLPAGTPCGSGGQCDGSGLCSTCLVSSDCGMGGPCEKRACVDGECVSEPWPLGYDPGFPQTKGDCKKVACDGAGAEVTILDDADVLSDGNACTTDTCSAGVPKNDPTPLSMCGTCTTPFQEQGYCNTGICYACP
jgi:hypothetical protein